MTSHTLGLRGKVASGRARAAAHTLRFEEELRTVVREPLVPGSLNVVLDGPVRLRKETSHAFDGGKRMLWSATLNNRAVWLYRWETAPLHVVEVLASVHLRSHFGFSDQDAVTLTVRDDQIEPVPAWTRLVWSVCWTGRRQWFYTDDRYPRYAEKICGYFNAVQAQSTRSIPSMAKSMLASVARRIPVVRPLARKLLGSRIAALGQSRYVYDPLPLAPAEVDAERSFRQVRNVLNYTKTSNSAYSAQLYPAGYHTLSLPEGELRGQRDPARRLALAPVDFQGLTVLDIGCNQGGMLFQLRDQIKWGVGIDYDARMINAANRVKAHIGAKDLNYYVFDLEKEPLSFIENLLPNHRVDVCFLLAVCMWLKNWREVCDFAQGISNAMLFETNGTTQQQTQQIDYLRLRYGSVLQLAAKSEDDPGQKQRMLYLCTQPVRRKQAD